MGPASNFLASLLRLTNPHGRERRTKCKEGEDTSRCSVLEYQAEEDCSAGPPLRAKSFHSVRTQAVWLVTKGQAPLPKNGDLGDSLLLSCISYHAPEVCLKGQACSGRVGKEQALIASVECK